MSKLVSASKPQPEKKQLSSTIGRFSSGGNVVQPKMTQKPTQGVSTSTALVEPRATATAKVVSNKPRGSLEQSEAAIKKFLEAYPKEKPIYDQLAVVTENICKDALRDSLGTKFLTMSRGKEMGIPVDESTGTLEKSIRRRLKERLDWESNVKGYYEDEKDICRTVHDLAGVRVILAFPDDDKVVHEFITTHFTHEKMPQYRGIDQDGKVKVKELSWGDLENRFIGYRATHYVVSLKDRVGQIFLGKQVEIQVTSMIMYAWQEVNHDLSYKVSAKIGKLTSDEKRTLDMVNGLVHANEVALNQFHVSLNRRVLKMDTDFATSHDLSMWLREYTVERWGLSSDSIVGRIGRLAQGFESLLLCVLFIYDYNNPRQLRALLDEPMPEVSKEPLITIREAVSNFENHYVMEDYEHQYSMWPLLKLCVKHSWLQNASGDAELDQKIYFLLNHVVLSRVFDVASSSWFSDSFSNFYKRKLTPESGKLFLHESDLMAMINDWTQSGNGNSVSAQETICPARVEKSWTSFLKEEIEDHAEKLEAAYGSNDEQWSKWKYLHWFENNTRMLSLVLALLQITADSRSQISLRQENQASNETAWHWPVHAADNTAPNAFRLNRNTIGLVCTTFVEDEGHWRKTMATTIEMKICASEPSPELRRILVDFKKLDKGTLEWVPGHTEAVEDYASIKPTISQPAPQHPQFELTPFSI